MTRARSLRIASGALFVTSFAWACTQVTPKPPVVERDRTADAAPAVDASTADGAGTSDADLDATTSVDAWVDAAPPEDPMANHKETREQLLTLVDLRPMTEAEARSTGANVFLALNVGPAVTRMNQGNKAIAKHLIGKEACLHALSGTVLQTDEQRARCGGPNMVPIFKNGDPNSATYCMDVFEFPNKPCELPFVYTAPTHARTMCALQGKRLCTQGEWQLACRGDPAGGADRAYAYGDELDLTVCNTNKPRTPPITCSPTTAKNTWETCSTETEPSGSYPRCRSRFGVFDQHGNVAEVMTRTENDGSVVTQLKGSAWFYAEVARKHTEQQVLGGRETYPDHCNFDPRWHVEPIDAAWHVNYHLGFRCCKSIAPVKASVSDAGSTSDASR